MLSGINCKSFLNTETRLALMYNLSNGVFYNSKKTLPAKLFNWYLTGSQKRPTIWFLFIPFHFDITLTCKPYLMVL